MKYKIAFESLAIFSLVILVISAASSLNFVSDESSEIIPNAYALKAKGKFLTEINSKLVCGDRLCSEVDEELLDSDSDGIDDEFDKCPFEFALTFDGCPIDYDDEPVVGGVVKDIWSGVTETYKSIESNVDLAVKGASAAIKIAENNIKDATKIALKDVGKYSTERWSEAKKLSVKGFDIAKTAYEETKKDLIQIVNSIEKEGICAAYATMKCTK